MTILYLLDSLLLLFGQMLPVKSYLLQSQVGSKGYNYINRQLRCL